MDRWLQEIDAVELSLLDKDDMSLQDLHELQEKTEEANAIMELVLQTQRQISDDNMRQGKVSMKTCMTSRFMQHVYICDISSHHLLPRSPT